MNTLLSRNQLNLVWHEVAMLSFGHNISLLCYIWFGYYTCRSFEGQVGNKTICEFEKDIDYKQRFLHGVGRIGRRHLPYWHWPKKGKLCSFARCRLRYWEFGAISKQSEYLYLERVKMLNANTADNPSTSSFASPIVSIWMNYDLCKSAETSVKECTICCKWIGYRLSS